MEFAAYAGPSAPPDSDVIYTAVIKGALSPDAGLVSIMMQQAHSSETTRAKLSIEEAAVRARCRRGHAGLVMSSQAALIAGAFRVFSFSSIVRWKVTGWQVWLLRVQCKDPDLIFRKSVRNSTSEIRIFFKFSGPCLSCAGTQVMPV